MNIKAILKSAFLFVCISLPVFLNATPSRFFRTDKPDFPFEIEAAAFSPQDKHIFILRGTGVLLDVDTITGKVVQHVTLDPTTPWLFTYDMQFNPKKNELYTGVYKYDGEDKDYKGFIYSVDSKTLKTNSIVPTGTHSGPNNVAVSSDGQTLYASENMSPHMQPRLFVMNTNTHKITKTLKVPKADYFTQMLFSDVTSNVYMSMGYAPYGVTYDVKANQLKLEEYPGYPSVIALNKNLAYLVSEDRVYVLDLNTNKVIKQLTTLLTGGGNGNPDMVVLNDNTKIYSSAGGADVEVIDVPADHLLTRINTNGTIQKLFLSPKNDFLYIVSNDNKISVIDVKTDTLVKIIEIS